MKFQQEETGYTKTAISDLQGAWTLLRDQVVEEFGFEGSDRLLLHIDEAMSWECVRALNQMKPLILVIDNIARQSDASDEIIELAKNVRFNYEDALEAIKEGKAFYIIPLKQLVWYSCTTQGDIRVKTNARFEPGAGSML